MTTIFKYHLQITRDQTVHMPIGARLLDVQFQDGELFVWAVVNPDADEFEHRLFQIRGTGHKLERFGDSLLGTYVATVQQPGLVWHVFAQESR